MLEKRKLGAGREPVQEDKAWEQEKYQKEQEKYQKEQDGSRSGEKHLQAAENRLENRKSLPGRGRTHLSRKTRTGGAERMWSWRRTRTGRS